MSRRQLLLALVLAVLVGAACAVSALGLTRSGPVLRQAPAEPLARSVETAARTAPAAPAAPTAPPSVEVLRAWDAERAAAWARGDPRLLAPLYTRASGAGRRDRAMLRAWTARGLSVRHLWTQLLAVREVNHSASTWTLLVTDRLAGGIAVGRGASLPLPHDGPTTRTVRLRLVDGTWRVASVTRGD